MIQVVTSVMREVLHKVEMIRFNNDGTPTAAGLYFSAARQEGMLYIITDGFAVRKTFSINTTLPFDGGGAINLSKLFSAVNTSEVTIIRAATWELSEFPRAWCDAQLYAGLFAPLRLYITAAKLSEWCQTGESDEIELKTVPAVWRTPQIVTAHDAHRTGGITVGEWRGTGTVYPVVVPRLAAARLLAFAQCAVIEIAVGSPTAETVVCNRDLLLQKI